MSQTDRALFVQVEQDGPIPLSGEFRCEPGELVALVGPSGAGKTSWLRVIAGLRPAAQALIQVGSQIWCDTEAGVHVPTPDRHVGMVFQDYALMPHLSAIDNVALALLRLPRPSRRTQAQGLLDRVGLQGGLQQHRPAALSGGQQQRVALARALARRPEVLLLDEPFSAVDPLTRQGLYTLLAELRQDLQVPIVLVTHDLAEARLLADRLVVMDRGQILQEGPPARIYRSPRNARVADLVGVQNRFFGRWLGPAGEHTARLEWLPDPQALAGIELRVQDKGKGIAPGQGVNWVIQGDGLRLLDHSDTQDAPPKGTLVQLPCRVSDIRHLGEISMVSVRLMAMDAVPVRLMLTGSQRQRWTQGQDARLEIDTAWVHVMPVRPT
jgi:molybdate transport system ATP-binding protein